MKRLNIRQQITDKSSLSFEKYLQEVAKLPEPLTIEEELKVISRIKNGDKKAEKELILRNLRFVISVAKQYQNYKDPLNDLVNIGNIGLIKAVGRYKEGNDARFISYAVWWIRQSILSFINDENKLVKLPANKVNQLNQIKKATKKLESLLCRQPTVEEIQQEVNVKGETIKRRDIIVILETNKDFLSLTTPMPDERGQTDTFQLIDVIEDDKNDSPDSQLQKESLSYTIQRLLAKLPNRNQKILTHYYGLDNQQTKTLYEISEILDLTRERVRQLKNESIEQLQSYSEFKKLL